MMNLKVVCACKCSIPPKLINNVCICTTVSIWTPNQEWPHPIRGELHVESLNRPKHAVHNEWLGTFLMTRIKNYSIQHPQLLCNLYLVSILLLDIEFLCTKNILYTWSYTIQTL